MWWWLLLIIPVALVALLVVMVVRALQLKPDRSSVPLAGLLTVDADAAAQRLSGAIRFETVSNQDRSLVPVEAFRGLHAYLAEAFPRVHAALTRETVADLSLLYTWPGSDPAAAPIILMGHLDVVPVAPGTEDQWEHPPFSGEIADGFIWGRGTLDDKHSVMALLEALDGLLAVGFKPKRTVYLVFGHDEEIGGQSGAKAVAELLASRGVKASFVVDEGMAIVDGFLPGVKRSVAMIGLAEKGYMSVQLRAGGVGGHSSMPPAATAIGLVSRAIARLEEHPFPARLIAPVEALFTAAAPEMGLASRTIFANLWLTRPLVLKRLTSKPNTASQARTTTAPTIFHAGVKENILPQEASAVVNFRLLQGDTIDSALERIRSIVGDKRVEVTALTGMLSNPSPISETSSDGYATLTHTIQQVFPGVLIAPSLVTGGTDSRHFIPITRDIYRFCPMRVTPEDMGRVHGTNERQPVADFAKIVQFYAQLIRNAG